MMRRLSRREALRLGGFGAAAFLHPTMLTGCGSDTRPLVRRDGGTRSGRDAGADSMAPDAFVPPNFDPDVPWWLQHNYRSVDERDAVDLEVVGAIPSELDGLYLRNGSNPASGEAGHWFLGDGMVHGVRIRDGRALWYKNRYVQTEPYLAGEGAGIPDGANNASNVSVIHHAGRLLTSGEVGFPYELSPDDLSTIGPYDYGGKLATWFSAHPKLDAVTGEMLTFGYDFEPPYVTYHRIDASGTLVSSQGIDLPASVMMHDFQITATRVVFMDLPILFDLEMAIAGEAFPFRWDGSNGARIGVMPRDGTNADVRWFDIDLCYIFHTLNAYDHPTRDGVVVMEAARHPKLWDSGPNDFGSTPKLYRYEIDLDAGSVTATQLDDRLTEFVQLDRRLVGREHRYGYGVWLGQPEIERPGQFRGLIKWDRKSDSSKVLELRPELELGEPYFVPATPDAGEDDGYLMTYVYDWTRDESDLYILDAGNMSAEPIARIVLPFRVPFGFHGIWVPAA